MKISELVAVLGKANQVAGDIPVILHDVESGAETELKKFGIEFNLTGESATSAVTLHHGPVTATPEPAPGEAPAPVGTGA